MKRIVTLLLAAGLVLGASLGAQAADIKVKGQWDFAFEGGNLGAQAFLKHDTADNFQADQRLRTQVDIIASESLKGVVFFEIGNTYWGQSKTGGALGTDTVNVEVRYSYIDWIVPNTDLKVRMGLQPFGLPSFNSDSVVYGGGSADSAALLLNYAFNDNVGVSLFWARPENDNNSGRNPINGGDYSDSLDAFGFTVPVTLDGFRVTPWAMMAVVGRDSLSASTGNSVGGQSSTLSAGMLPTGIVPGLLQHSEDSQNFAWWAGVSAEMTYFAPFRLSFDGVYGSVDYGNMYNVPNFDMKRAGWYASLLAEYKLDMMTPGLMFWYASGDDSDASNGSERLPSIRSNFNITSYGYANTYSVGTDTALTNSAAGTWGIQARLKDISFMEDLKHTLAVTYTRGTNNTTNAWNGIAGSPWGGNGERNFFYLTTADSVWEVNLDTKYNIYKDLLMVFELGYLRLDLDEDAWTAKTVDEYGKNNFRAGVNLIYSF